MKKNVFQDDGGYAVVLAIMLLATLMMGGVLLSNSSVTDLGVVKNTVVHSQNLAGAESAAMTAVQILEEETDKDTINPPPGVVSSLETSGSAEWLNTYENINTPTEDENCTTKDQYWKTITLNNLTSRMSSENAKLKFRAVRWRPSPGSSLGAYNETSLYECAIRGVYYSTKYGATSVEMGFKKRF